ncbi:MAG: flippase [Candidatus Paceibacterota bacterium]|jgi:O-antigen/teichoic acid export membrane protein
METNEIQQTDVGLLDSFYDWNAFKTYIKEKWQHAGFQRYFKNTGWMFIGQAAMVISLFINIWIARYLGPANFGTLSYVLAFVGIFGFLANLGINDVLVRDLVKYPEKRDELLGTAFWLFNIGGFLAFLSVSILSFFLEPSWIVRSLIIVYATTFLFAPVGMVIAAYYQSKVEARKNAFVQIVGTVIVAIFKIYLILSGKGIIWFTLAFILDYTVGAVLCLFNYRRSNLAIRAWTFSSAFAKKLLSVSYLLMLSAVAGYLLLKVDQVMIKFYLGEVSVGLYAVAVKLSEIWYFIPGIICSSVFPAIINAKKSDENMYRGRLKKLYMFLGGGALLIAIPIAALAPWLIQIMFGAAYASSVPILQIYIWSGIGLFLSTGLNRYFLAENRLKPIFYYNLLSLLANIILNMILIPRVGLTGAAWATFISYSIYPVFAFLFNTHEKR